MFVCQVCGKLIEKSMYSGSIICSDECFDKNFWDETLDEDAIIINGTCYHVDDEDEILKGHCGRKYHIEMNDGRTFYTTNLWCNGDVPEDRHIEDNARFIG